MRLQSTSPIEEFDAVYTPAEVGGALRIAALAHNEIPRWRECLARLQAQHGREA